MRPKAQLLETSARLHAMHAFDLPGFMISAKTGDGVDGSAAGANALRCSLCRLTFTSGNALHKHLKEAHSGTHKKKR